MKKNKKGGLLFLMSVVFGGFLGGFVGMFKAATESHEIILDVKTAKKMDPAAKSYAEILFLYQGGHALITYRIAHWLYIRKHFFLARWISQHSRKRTLIEIHSGAILGHGIFIDHGAGVVIGETAEVGDNCLIYQCVTLGGTGKDIGKRHPTLGKNVMVGASAQVLGPIYIGDNCKVASNAVVLILYLLVLQKRECLLNQW